MWDESYDYDEYYGTTLKEDHKALIEDCGHLYFTVLGIIMCWLSGPGMAVLAALVTLLARDWWRGYKRKHK